MNDLTDLLADALEAICKDATPRKGMQCGSPSFAHFEIKGRLLDEAQEILSAYRAQRDGEREAKMCLICFGSGKWKFHGGEQECPGCKGAGKIAPLAKGEG